MEDWWKTTLLLCIYGFFKEIRPSEPYLTEYLVGNSTGLTDEQVRLPCYIFLQFLTYILLMVRREQGKLTNASRQEVNLIVSYLCSLLFSQMTLRIKVKSKFLNLYFVKL